LIREVTKSYLTEELFRLKDRLERLDDFINSNPSKSVIKKVLRGRIYYYEKFSHGGKAIDVYLCKGETEMLQHKIKFEEEKSKKKQAKEKRLELRKDISFLERQLKIIK
jgi:hypothetical protein